MAHITRRSFIELAIALGATTVWADPFGTQSRTEWRERRDLYPEGLHRAILKATAFCCGPAVHQPGATCRNSLNVEIAEDESFGRVVATADSANFEELPTGLAACWSADLKPSRIYWYRFTDREGNGSRVGPDDHGAGRERRPGRCASPLSVARTPTRRAKRLPADDLRGRARRPSRIGWASCFTWAISFTKSSGTRKIGRKGMYDRRIRDMVRYQHGEKIEDFHIPTMVDDYRAVYRAYLHDPDLQDARARWPFVCMWDNHEFSWQGWQGLQKFRRRRRAPHRLEKSPPIRRSSNISPRACANRADHRSNQFDPPRVVDAPITRFDDHGLGQEPNNLAAIGSLKGYRALRWGRNVDLIITDQRSYRSEEPTGRAEAEAFSSNDFPEFMPAGSHGNTRRRPHLQRRSSRRHSIRFGEAEIPNFRKDQPPQTILGAEQKAWFLERLLKLASATWKIWGNTAGHPGHARRSAKPAGRSDQAVARRGIRRIRRRRSQQRLRRARRNL